MKPNTYPNAAATTNHPVSGSLQTVIRVCSRIPDSLIALVGRFSIAAVFWKSGQTKVEGFVIDIVSGDVRLGWPHLCGRRAETVLILPV